MIENKKYEGAKQPFSCCFAPVQEGIIKHG